MAARSDDERECRQSTGFAQIFLARGTPHSPEPSAASATPTIVSQSMAKALQKDPLAARTTRSPSSSSNGVAEEKTSAMPRLLAAAS